MQMTPTALQRIRQDAPSLDEMLFMLSCGASIMPQPVVNVMAKYLELEARVGGYGAAERNADSLSGVYDSVARLINAERNEIALVENATVAWQMAFYSMQFRRGDRILTVEAEYAANYVAFLQARKRYGVSIEVIPSGPTGETDLDALERMIDSRVKLIAVTWVPTNGGLTNPAEAIGQIANRHGIPYLLDACQAVGQMPVDVRQLKCDFLTATSRKFLRGPRGVGFLYARAESMARLEPFSIDHFAAPWTSREEYTLRNDARRFETWESNLGAHLGLGAAVEYALSVGLEVIQSRCCSLSDRLRNGLREFSGITVLDLGTRPCAIVSFVHNHLPAAEVVKACATRNLFIGASNGASTRIDAERRGLVEILRAAPHYFNTEEEVDRTLAVIAEVLEIL